MSQVNCPNCGRRLGLVAAGYYCSKCDLVVDAVAVDAPSTSSSKLKCPSCNRALAKVAAGNYCFKCDVLVDDDGRLMHSIVKGPPCQCPKCQRKMNYVTPTQVGCMRCGVRVHAPTDTPYTGDPKQDEFIGMPMIPAGEPDVQRDNFEGTLTQDALVLTWIEGNVPPAGPPAETFYSFGAIRIPYLEMTSAEKGLRSVYDFIPDGAGKSVSKAIDITLSVLSQGQTAKVAVATLQVSTTNVRYDLLISPGYNIGSREKRMDVRAPDLATFVQDIWQHYHPSHAETWVKKLYDLMCSAHRKAARFCRNCGTFIQSDWTFCKQCGMKP